MRKKVFVSGCYDMLHSGHVAFFKEASQYGDLYVGIGSDSTIEELKHRKTVYSEKERLYMVKAIRYVTDAFINQGSGMLDFVDTMDAVRPDVFVVNSDGGSDVCARVEGKDITPEKVRALTSAADHCWDAIMRRDLGDFAASFRESFDAQVAMFPAMMQPGVAEYIDSIRDKALAWKMLGAGGGGHLALVLPDNSVLTPDMIPIKIRRF